MSQAKYQGAISKLQSAMLETGIVSQYWTDKLEAAAKLSVKLGAQGGDVQATLSNPLAYFVVPLYGDGTRGRSHEFTIKQFQFALVKGYTGKADKMFRGVSAEVIEAGLTFTRAKGDSVYGTVGGRIDAAKVSSAASQGADVSKIAESVVNLENVGYNAANSPKLADMLRQALEKSMTELTAKQAKTEEPDQVPAVKPARQRRTSGKSAKG